MEDPCKSQKMFLKNVILPIVILIVLVTNTKNKNGSEARKKIDSSYETNTQSAV